MEKEKLDKKKVDKTDVIESLELLKKDFEDLKNKKISYHMSKIISNLDLIDEHVKILKNEIDYLMEEVKRSKRERNYSKVSQLNSIIAARMRLMKNLYESRADLEGILQGYYKIIFDSEIKISEQYLKAYKEITKIEKELENSDKENIQKVILDFIRNVAINNNPQLNQNTQNDENMDNNREEKKVDIDKISDVLSSLKHTKTSEINKNKHIDELDLIMDDEDIPNI